MDYACMSGPTISGLALRALARHSDRVAFQYADEQLTYAQTSSLIAWLQDALKRLGLARQSRVALLGGNRSRLWCAQVAAQSLGLATTALHPRGSEEEHLRQMRDADVSLLIVHPGRYDEAGRKLEADSAWSVATLGPMGFGKDLLAGYVSEDRVPKDEASPEEMASLVYTGGTSGKAKGIVRRHAAAVATCNAFMTGLDLPRTPRYLAVAPISHVSGQFIVPTLLRGGTVHLVDEFTPKGVLSLIEEQGINFTLMVPTMVYALLDEPSFPDFDISSLELLVYGAAPMSVERLHQGLERIGPVFAQAYGQSECAPISVLSREDHDLTRPHLLSSCGVPIPSCDIALFDEAGQPVKQGDIGEICVRSAQAMDTYWNNPQETSVALAGGWLHTGDLARADASGHLYIVDRKKDMIISGGFNVYCREVEDVLAAHPAVAAVAVVGLPDPVWGEAVAAFVVSRPDSIVDANALTQLVKQKKGSVHAPKHVTFLAALPLSGLGKVDKKALRTAYGRSPASELS